MDGCVSPPQPKRRKLGIPEEHAANVLTVYSWNVNGIQPFIQSSITSYFKHEGGRSHSQAPVQASLRDFLRRHNWPQLLFLQEVKINPDDSATIQAVAKAVRRGTDEPSDAYDYEAHFCLPKDEHNARGFGRKVYGVCSIVRKDFRDQFVTQVRQVKWDSEGRFLVVETKAIGKMPKLAVFNIYAVNGTDHPYKHSTSGEIIGTRHDRKLQVHALLQDECRRLEADGFGIILSGDLNIARSTADGHPNLRTFPKQHCLNRADFEARFFSNPDPSASRAQAKEDVREDDSGLGMIDTFRHLHPNQQAYTYYPRSRPFGASCDRVDLIMISEKLKTYLSTAGMHETPSERGPSDHVPLYAQLAYEGEIEPS